MLLFILKMASRRQINYQWDRPIFLRNLSLLAETEIRDLPHSDTLAYLMEKLPYDHLCRLRYKIIYQVIRKKALNNWRLLDKYHLIAIDGTGYLSFKKEHCAHCMRIKQHGIVHYRHPILDAKLVTGNGLALSMETEFIENTDPNRTKQDCELLAFYRLAEKLKKNFPQMHICLLLDGLYANKPVFRLCKRYGWKYIITFKEGSMPDVYNWYETMRDKLFSSNYKEVILKDVVQKYKWVSPLEYYIEDEIFHVFECLEEYSFKNKLRRKKRTKKKHRHFVWFTNIEVTENNITKLANHGGRLRWKIENEGFNSQKNGGYELEHVYSEHPVGMKNFYLLMQIAHLFNQLLEKGSLLKDLIEKEFGSLRNISRLLLENLRHNLIDPQVLYCRIQIRLNSS